MKIFLGISAEKFLVFTVLKRILLQELIDSQLNYLKKL